MTIFQKIPILGWFFKARWRDYLEALKEFLFTMGIGLTPLWVGACAVYFYQQAVLHEPIAYFQCLSKFYSKGELFCYSAATIGSIFYILSKDRSIFPIKVFYYFFSIFILVLSTIAFFIQATNAYPLWPQSLIDMSLFLFWVALAVYYTALVFDNFLKDSDISLNSDEQDLMTEVKKRRG